MSRPRLLAGLPVVLVSLVAAAPAAATAVPMRVDAAATCAPKRVYVRYSDGVVRLASHVAPGASISRVGHGTKNLFLVLRLQASWSDVKRSPGTTFQVTADGPRGERWRWGFRVASSNPERDSSNYTICFRPRSGNASIVKSLRQNPGSWLFSVVVTKGRLTGSRDGVRLTVAR